jgi:DNA-binding NarL/FixJ family response regulator/signal transduction histidine kinase
MTDHVTPHELDDAETPSAILAQLAQQLESSMAPHLVLTTVCKTLAQTLRTPQVSISLRRSDSDEYELGAQFQNSDAPFPPSASRLKPQRFPIIYRGETIGQLILAADQAHPALSVQDSKTIGLIAQHVGGATYVVRMTRDLQHARERLVLTREEERRRLRRNLHEAVGPTLTTIALKMGALRERVQPDQTTEAMVTEVREQIRQVVTQIRHVIYDLRPPALEELGLLMTIREQAQQFSIGGLQVVVHTPEFLPPLPAAVEVAAYRIVLEALSNVATHSRATHCEVNLRITDQLLIDVIDNGVGVPERLQVGVGISSMRERVSELGGNCAFTKAPGGGTHVSVHLPMFHESATAGTGDGSNHIAVQSVTGSTANRTPGQPVKVMLVDDHRFFREGVRNVLKNTEDMQVVAEAGTGTEAVELAAAHQPNVILMDLHMPGINGVEATHRILSVCPDVCIVVLSMSEDTDSVLASLRAGACGYILKDADEAELLRAIRAAAHGEAFFGRAISRRLRQYVTSIEPSSARMAFPELTEREREILSLMAHGMSNDDIVQRLGTSLKTVRNQVSSILTKLQIPSRDDAISRARAAGLAD